MHVGIIGTGRLGSLLVRKLIERGAVTADEITASNRTPEKLRSLEDLTGINVGDNKEVVIRSDVVILCLRPLDIRGVLEELKDVLTHEKLLISTAVDFPLEDLSSSTSAKVVKVVPSITSEHLRGVSLVAFGPMTTEMDMDMVMSIFGTISSPALADEEDFEVLADITSCGPGYIAAIMKEFARAAANRGVPREHAEWLIKETLAGTSDILSEEGLDELISSTATNGGITEEGLKVIREMTPAVFDRLFDTTKAKHLRLRTMVKNQALKKEDSSKKMASRKQ